MAPVFLLLAVSGFALQFSCTGGSAGAGQAEAGAQVEGQERKLPEVPTGTLPPLQVGAQYKTELPPEGGNYDLKPSANLPRPADRMVYRVKRWVPGTTLEEGKAYAAKFGLNEYKGIHETSKEPFYEGEAGRGYFRPLRSAFTYHSSAWKDVDGKADAELKAMADASGVNSEKARKIGFDWIKTHGLLPDSPLVVDYENGSSSTTTNAGAKVDYRFSFEYHGKLGRCQVVGPGARLDFVVIVNGKLTDLTVSWAEVEELGMVECKSPREANEALNTGRAGPVLPELRGGQLGTKGMVYYAEGPGGTVLQPCYEFALASEKGERGTYYVPAAKDKYFKDPKRQVEVLSDIR